MPQLGRLVMKGQRGSVLAGIVALSSIMTLAATGLILVASNVTSVESEALRSYQAFNSAESGRALGVRWLREKNVAWFDALPSPDTVVITPGLYQNLDGCNVLVRLRVSGSIAPYTKTLEVLSTPGGTSDTVKVSWAVNSVVTSAPLTKVDMANWSQIILPYSP